jgi:hypothetical protein
MNKKILIFTIFSIFLFLTMPAYSALNGYYQKLEQKNKIIETNLEKEQTISEPPEQSGIILKISKLIWNLIKWGLTSDGLLAVIFRCNVLTPNFLKIIGGIFKLAIRIILGPITGGLFDLIIGLITGKYQWFNW